MGQDGSCMLCKIIQNTQNNQNTHIVKIFNTMKHDDAASQVSKAEKRNDRSPESLAAAPMRRRPQGWTAGPAGSA